MNSLHLTMNVSSCYTEAYMNSLHLTMNVSSCYTEAYMNSLHLTMNVSSCCGLCFINLYHTDTRRQRRLTHTAKLFANITQKQARRFKN